MNRQTSPARVTAVYRGGHGGALPDGTASGIYKSPVTGRIALGRDGLAGDYHADRSVHGGHDKALHHYPAGHYRLLATAFPAAGSALVAGSIGENLSLAGLDEHAVHIGDVFALGDARIQVTQPRRPCWKIDRRYDAPGMAEYIRREALTGWYYRVLQAGPIGAGDALELCEREVDAPSVAEFHRLTATPRPPLERLRSLLAVQALPLAWRRRLSARIAWLERHAEP